jgi:hypothetical protein
MNRDHILFRGIRPAPASARNAMLAVYEDISPNAIAHFSNAKRIELRIQLIGEMTPRVADYAGSPNHVVEGTVYMAMDPQRWLVFSDQKLDIRYGRGIEGIALAFTSDGSGRWRMVCDDDRDTVKWPPKFVIKKLY